MSISSLYIILFLHQTTTRQHWCCFHQGCISFFSYIKPQPLPKYLVLAIGCISFFSYIKPQHNRAYNVRICSCISFFSYIKPQLISYYYSIQLCCISFFSYIKPQHYISPQFYLRVVYHSFPTSNHNMIALRSSIHPVVYHSFPTSNHNLFWGLFICFVLYIILFLHQTTTLIPSIRRCSCCISFFSYIKPQLLLCVVQ